MKCLAVNTTAPCTTSYLDVDIGEPLNDEAVVDVSYSAICRTDFSVIDGSLIYYRNGHAKYPIITGHEWVGICEGTPVVGLCIIGCDKCRHCLAGNPIYCDNRIETGVVNKNGGHAQKVIMPRKALLEVPEASAKFAMVEPMAVAVRGFRRLNPSKSDKILINGYGSIGKMFGRVLMSHGYAFDFYDIRYNRYCNWDGYNVFIESSGGKFSLKKMLNNKGCRILAYGFEYSPLDVNNCVANEITILTSLGSDKSDFQEAIDIVTDANLQDFEMHNLSNFNAGLERAKMGNKVVFNNKL